MMKSVFPVTCHTDYVGQGSTFVVINGLNEDGCRYIPLAIEKGARTLVIQKDVILSDQLKDLCKTSSVAVVVVENTRKELALLSAAAAGYPARSLKIIGVTGTKGKTTTVHMLYQLLVSAGKKVALISTTGNKLSSCFDSLPTTMTTPQPDYLHQFFALCVQEQIEYVVMEVAAQALTYYRIETLQFDAAIFLNLEKEHGELYQTIDCYFQTKAKIIEYLKPTAELFVNSDDFYGKLLLKTYPHRTKSFSIQDQSVDFYMQPLEYAYEPYQADFLQEILFYSRFPGKYNASNLCAALSVCSEQGFTVQNLQDGLQNFSSIPGRLEMFTLANGAQVYIDYAHTPASFQGLFELVRPLTDQLIVVFGAGGGKDKEKRSLMGKLAALYADKVILTNDNPRNENPVAIIYDIAMLINSEVINQKCEVIFNRKDAIERALQIAQKRSIILVLGKGPDEYQIIGNQKYPLSEKKIIEAYR